jgi:hypothetical protein
LISSEKNCTDKVLASFGLHLLPIPARIALSFFSIIITIASSSQNSLSRSLRSAWLASPVWQPSGASKDSGRTIPTIICMEGRIDLRTVGRWTDSMLECSALDFNNVKFKGNSWEPVITNNNTFTFGSIKLGTSWGTNRWARFTLKELLSEPKYHGERNIYVNELLGEPEKSQLGTKGTSLERTKP